MRIKLGINKVRNFVLIAILVLSAFGGGYYFGVLGYKAEVKEALEVKISRTIPPDKNVDFALFWQVWDILSAKYYDKTKLVPSDMVNGAISGMVAALGDPYTMFLSPEQNKIVDEDLSGSFEGVGIEIGFRDGNLAVVAPLSGSPAEKAGLKAGDYIMHIKDSRKGIDIDTSGITTPEAVSAIRGPAGTKVSLTVIRDKNPEPIVFEITRAKLDVPSIVLKFVGDSESVAHIKINKFASETPSEWDKAIQEVIKKPGVKGIVLDLRNNPGGYLQAAVDVAANFLPTGTTVVVQEEGGGEKIEYKTEKFGILQKVPVVILINGGSASASEILAGALRDQRGIKLVGIKSFGKGTVQDPLEITGGAGLHVTTAKWLTPNGTWVHEKGLEPDIVIETGEDVAEDLQLKEAVKILEEN